MNVTRAEANINYGTPPIFQFNLKYDILGGTDRDMVQISSNYISKESFDNAFSNNSLVLSFSNQNLQSVCMEIAGMGYIGNDSVSDNFQVTIVKNNDGTYNLTSRGSFVSQNKIINNIKENNIIFDE